MELYAKDFLKMEKKEKRYFSSGYKWVNESSKSIKNIITEILAKRKEINIHALSRREIPPRLRPLPFFFFAEQTLYILFGFNLFNVILENVITLIRARITYGTFY